ncbi:hypothetical protein OCL06_11585 [Alteromonas sp. ASW11-19]|uniref:Glycoside hydrolase family 2 catalytic domain-containing protein n=1 Tax=Alteromonas salexigens TaxID=2982530 RepID=A0ABT2VPJ8_9ALTE|nr:glycoside hydrolase family 2 TIM barrel-domain containing protein [Alteromonas salexigens]MCU7555235.1 hypothetical protein [Alteromonas salexigens]
MTVLTLLRPTCLALVTLITACATTPQTSRWQPIPVTLVENEGEYHLQREGERYFIKGAGGTSQLSLLAASGANSVRTWSADDAERILNTAHQHGLTVMLGLSLGKERHGFDYDNQAAVDAQFERVRKTVQRFKSHPALLAWGVGNELDLFYTNTAVWDAVQRIAAMIQQEDPHHLVTTVTAGIDAQKAALIAEKVPAIDFLSINMYGGLEELPAKLADIGYTGPFVVTEWGPTGHWEVEKTPWGAPIEQTSTEKAASYQFRYEQGIAAARGQSLGSYAFLWGQKQETTPTWYGVFTEAGQPNEVVDTLSYVWTGNWPTVRAPSVSEFTVNGQSAHEGPVLGESETATARVVFTANSSEPASVRWEILPESTDIKAGGDPESRPQAVTGRIINDDRAGMMEFAAPAKAGAYRLFVYIENRAGKVATANVPFLVK